MFQRILVPIDASSAAAHGLREAIALAAAQRARLLLLHVVDDFGRLVSTPSAAIHADFLKQLRQRGLAQLTEARRQAEAAGVPCETLLREITREPVADTIADQAQQHHCDLIVMGTAGRRGLQRFALGSCAGELVRISPVPVLLVREQPPQA